MSDKKTSIKLASILRGFEATLEAAVKAESVKQEQVVKQLKADVKELEVKSKGTSRSKGAKLRNYQGATLEQCREMLAFAEGREERTKVTCDSISESLREFIKSKRIKTVDALRDYAPAWTPEAYREVGKVKGRRARTLASSAVASIAKIQ